VSWRRSTSWCRTLGPKHTRSIHRRDENKQNSNAAESVNKRVGEVERVCVVVSDQPGIRDGVHDSRFDDQDDEERNNSDHDTFYSL
jgi:hypothetical protein